MEDRGRHRRCYAPSRLVVLIPTPSGVSPSLICFRLQPGTVAERKREPGSLGFSLRSWRKRRVNYIHIVPPVPPSRTSTSSCSSSEESDPTYTTGAGALLRDGAAE